MEWFRIRQTRLKTNQIVEIMKLTQNVVCVCVCVCGGLSHKCVGFQPQNVKLHTRALAVMVSFSLIPRPFPPPVLDRLQQANMEGKGLGDLSMCGDIRQTEGRHTVGGARWRISKPFLVLSVQGLEARALARQCQYHLLLIAPGTVQHETEITTVGYCPPCVYHLFTWCNCTWPNLPVLPPPYLHTVSNQILEVGTAWELVN